MRNAVAIAQFFVALTTVTSAFGHGGEDHGAPPPPVTQAVEPRAVAATEEFELVAALEGKQLVVYIDRFNTNEPVVQASVEVEGSGLKGKASEVSPGTYVLDVVAPLSPAKHPLTVSVEAGDSVDLLTATLDTSASVANVVHTHGWSEWIVWILSGALLLVTGIAFAVRRCLRSRLLHKHDKKGI